MLYLCKHITDRSGMKGIRIFECRGLDSLVVIPEEIKRTAGDRTGSLHFLRTGGL